MDRLSLEKRYGVFKIETEHREHPHFVYFLHNPLTDLIKIGYTFDVKVRIQQLNHAQNTELNYLGFIDGGKEKELELHTTFRQQREAKEWFRKSPQLTDFIESNCNPKIPIVTSKRAKPKIVTGSYNLDVFEMRQTGLTIREDVTYEEWASIGKDLAGAYSKLQWAIGDWLNFGERKFGEMYAQAEDDTHFAYGTLRNYASICARIPPENRDPKLRFHQIKHVACLEPHEQRAIISAAVQHQMTGDDILEAVQKVKGKTSTNKSIEGWVLHEYDVAGDEYIIKIRVNKDGLDYLQEVYTVTIRAK